MRRFARRRGAAVASATRRFNSQTIAGSELQSRFGGEELPAAIRMNQYIAPESAGLAAAWGLSQR